MSAAGASFDKLVQALTCPKFHLNSLKSEVAWTVLYAAVGEKESVCSILQNKSPFPGAGGYTWGVRTATTPGTQLIYLAKKDGKEQFRIVFNGAEPVVWVSDWQKYTSVNSNTTNTSKTDICNEITTNIFTPNYKQKYQNYDLHLIINGNDCLMKFGTADYYHKREQLLRPKPYEIWVGSCLAAVGACKFILGALSAGTTGAAELFSGGRIMLHVWWHLELHMSPTSCLLGLEIKNHREFRAL